MKQAKTVNLTSGNVWKQMLLYSLPLFGSALVQQLYSLADLLVVGNFAEEGALAIDAIGNATVIINVLLAFAFGANGGCSVIIAKYFGARDNKKVRESFNTSMIAFSALCVVIMAFGFGFGGLSLKALDVADSYYGDCLNYLYIYMGSLPFVFLYNLGCGICSALGDSKTPFIFLVISSVLNVGLDLLFVCVLHMDVAGAAWATFLSQAISCAATFFVLMRKMRAVGTEEKPKYFDKKILKELTFASVPIILQQSFVSVGNFFVTRCINGIGEDATTGFTTAFKLVVVATMSIVAMTNGLSNFISQNKAVGEFGRIKTGFLSLFCYAVLISLIFLAVFVSCPKPLTELFIQKDKLTPDALDYSMQFLVIVSCFLPVVCVKIVADGAVRGCGGNLGFTISTFTDLLLRVILVYVLVGTGWGFKGVCWAWAIGWSISMVIALVFWYLHVRKFPKKQTAEISTENTTDITA
ncbi:MAG: MATE family efflux transporter [Clostridia bacterium]|nr:MATE family efflux transporter [Clostridia bacterium]